MEVAQILKPKKQSTIYPRPQRGKRPLKKENIPNKANKLMVRKIARKIARNKHVFANGSPERSSEDHQLEENNSSNKVVPKST